MEIEMEQRSCLCCGTPVDTAVRYVGFADLLLGISTGVVTLIHLMQIKDRENLHYVDHKSYLDYKYSKIETFPQMLIIPTWLTTLACVSAWIQGVMGIVICSATYLQSRSICHFWLLMTALTCLFTGIPIRVFEMMVVQEFAHVVLVEQRQLPSQGNKRKPPFTISHTTVHPTEQLSAVIIPHVNKSTSDDDNVDDPTEMEDLPPSYEDAVVARFKAKCKYSQRNE